MPKAKGPFRFFSRLTLPELVGLKASNLRELLELARQVPGSCIYHHTHRFLQQHEYLSPEPPNDFAYWVSKILGEDDLGEQLASIDIIQFPTIRSLREKIVKTIEDYLAKRPSAERKFAHPGTEFYFIRSNSFVFPTKYVVYSLEEFACAMEKITIDSIYYHVFEARLRLEKGTNDFSQWIEKSFANKPVADRIAALDPYTFTLDDLRKKIIKIVMETTS